MASEANAPPALACRTSTRISSIALSRFRFAVKNCRLHGANAPRPHDGARPGRPPSRLPASLSQFLRERLAALGRRGAPAAGGAEEQRQSSL
jgi:hypothetical protein